MNAEELQRTPGDEEAGSASGSPDREPPPGGDATCPSCGGNIPPGARSCPHCYRGVYRTCFCGWQLPASEKYCPNCDADWSQSMRVARKSRSRTPRRARAARYAVMGAVLALFAGLFAYIGITGLALVAVEEGGELPPEFTERLSLAASGALELATRTAASLARYVIVAAVVLGLLIFGAVFGVSFYIVRIRFFNNAPRRSSRTVRRKRRNS